MTTEKIDAQVKRETITGTAGGQGHNVFVGTMHIGSYTGPIDLTNPVEAKALTISRAINRDHAFDGLVEALKYAMLLIEESPGANEQYRIAAERKAKEALAAAGVKVGR